MTQEANRPTPPSAQSAPSYPPPPHGTPEQAAPQPYAGQPAQNAYLGQPPQNAYPEQPPQYTPPGQPVSHAYPEPPAPYGYTGQPATGGPSWGAVPPQRKRLAVVAFSTAVVGLLAVVSPSWFGLGWLLLPTAFVLSIVALAGKRAGRGFSVAALVISIVGPFFGFIAFASNVATGDDAESPAPVAKSGGSSSKDEAADVMADDGGSEAGEASDPVAEAVPDGTRKNPFPLGTSHVDRSWEITVNSVVFDADQAVASENYFNEAPEKGHEYILVNVSATYVGDDKAVTNMPDGSVEMIKWREMNDWGPYLGWAPPYYK